MTQTNDELIMEALDTIGKYLCNWPEMNAIREKLRNRYIHPEKSSPTLESVYGCQGKPAPNGWRFKLIGYVPEFRVPNDDERWMRPDGTVSDCVGGMDEPRLILVKCKRMVFDIIGEDRPPLQGELLSIGPTVIRAGDKGYSMARYILSEPWVEE